MYQIQSALHIHHCKVLSSYNFVTSSVYGKIGLIRASLQV